MAGRPERLITYEDYATFPDEPRLEVIGGEAYVVPSPNTRHQTLVGRIFAWLHAHIETHGGGRVFVAPFDVVLSDNDIVQPDVVFIADEDTEVLTEANVRGTPSWAIEILSPSDPARDRSLKLGLYERSGLSEYWIVDPRANTITLHRLERGSYGPPEVLSQGQVARPLVPVGFALDLDDLFSGRSIPAQ